MSFKKHIPNGITLLNMFSGCIAVYFASFNKLEIAVFFALLGIFFDFFDGFFARLFNVQSELGLQLDSLADMVTSGLVPGMIMFQLLRNSHLASNYMPSGLINFSSSNLIPFLGFIITVASGYRLAKFNIDTRQTSSFIGLPTPANTLLIISLGLISYYQSGSLIATWLLNTYVLLGIIIFSSYILNAEIPLFALKFKTWGLKENWVRYTLILSTILLVLFLGYSGILATILLYILLSVITKNN